MVQVQQGRTELFEQLVARYRDRLLRFAAGKLGECGRAEDVVQETFLAVYSARHTYNSRFAFSTWIWTILLNLCRREWRAQRREADRFWQAAAAQSSLPGRGNSGASSETGLSALLRSEQQELLGALLEALPEAESDALRLRFYGGLTFEEIAATMNSSLSGAKVRVRRGLERLAERLRDPADLVGANEVAGRPNSVQERMP
jgi:RNA polymerase sigma-70 factor (ECF subfamily)